MIAPPPYDRPARDPARRRPPPGPACTTDDLDRDLLARFAAAGRVSLCELMDGIPVAWALAAYDRLEARGLISEDPDTRRVAITPAGREELARGDH